MKNKKPKETKKDMEIAHALSILEKHNVSVFTLEDKDFIEYGLLELWKRNGVKPTKENLKQAREKAMDYICGESWEIMEDTIEFIAMKEDAK